jgi:hypothetical protein
VAEVAQRGDNTESILSNAIGRTVGNSHMQKAAAAQGAVDMR